MTGVARLIARFTDIADAVPHSFIALLSRFVVATIFWRSGQTKVDGFHVTDAAIYLFREEYKLPLIDPVVAANLAALAEHLFPALLVIGLASRLSALGLMGVTLIIQIFVYPGSYIDHGLWAIALLVIIARGPGVFSLDQLIKSWWSRKSPQGAVMQGD